MRYGECGCGKQIWGYTPGVIKKTPQYISVNCESCGSRNDFTLELRGKIEENQQTWEWVVTRSYSHYVSPCGSPTPEVY